MVPKYGIYSFDKSKVSKFCLEKNLFVNRFKYSLPSLHKSLLHMKLQNLTKIYQHQLSYKFSKSVRFWTTLYYARLQDMFYSEFSFNSYTVGNAA